MRKTRITIPRLLVTLAAVLAAIGPAHAATISATPHANFTRLSFDFGRPVRMQVSQGGTAITLRFDHKIEADAASVKLPAHVTKASIGADGKSITFALDKPYRVRQFISGNTVGLDVLTGATPQPDAKAATPEKPKEAEKPPTQTPKAQTPAEQPADKKAAPAQKPAAKPKPTPVEKITPPAITKPTVVNRSTLSAPEKLADGPVAAPEPAKVTPPPAPVEAVPAAPAPTSDSLTRIKPEPAPEPAPAPAEPAAIATPNSTDTLLTTKPVVTAPAVDPMLSTVTVPPAPEASEAITSLNTTKTAEPAPEPVNIAPEQPSTDSLALPAITNATTAPPTVPLPPQDAETVTPEEAAAINAVPEPEPNKPFHASVKTVNNQPIMNFPWGARTGAAVFERARDIWIVFNRERDASPELLASSLPKQVVKVEQYKLAGATVLRLTTDGSLHATADQPAGGYEWNITLSADIPKPALDVPVTTNITNEKRGLELKAFDTADPFYFYDPDTRDRVIVVPTYENGRGVSNLRQFPELAILATQQGIAMITQRDDIRAEKVRTGIVLHGDQSMAVSENLPIVAPGQRPVPGASAASGVLMPYDQWYVPPEQFSAESHIRLYELAKAPPARIADNMMAFVQLYLGNGMGVEALGYLKLIQEKYPDYYAEHSLGVLAAAANTLMHHIPEAREAVADPSLADKPEAVMWQNLLAVQDIPSNDTVRKLQQAAEAESAARQKAAAEAAVANGTQIPEPETPATPASPLTFDFLRYNDDIIRYYPPRIRQKMAIIAGDAYIAVGKPAEAVKVYDTLNRDGILKPIQPYAEFALGMTAASKPDKQKEALATFDKLSKQYDDLYIQARARYAAIKMRYEKGMMSADDTASALETLRMSWRGDALQRNMLITLADIYTAGKQYDNTLRTWKTLLDTFPNDPDTLTISGDMTALFQNLFLNGQADEMPPLKSLALFYEFRELTPIGDSGDEIIQKLADRLAAVDLLDRATQLLEHQIKFRVSGEARARVGARLALLYLLNHQPKEALSTLEVTNYGEAPKELRDQRIRLTAQALSDTGKHEEALSMMFNDDSTDADLLRLDILWAMKDWPNVINQAEDIMSNRPNLTAALSERETEVLMKLALGYSFEGDSTQLRYLRDYYSGLLVDGQYKEIFDYLTNDTAPLDPEDFQLVAQQISHTESFLDSFRKKVAAGELSNAVK